MYFMGAWQFSWLPFATINRVCFLYHYLLPLYFSSLLSLCVILQLRASRFFIFLVVALAAAAFVYWAPVAYGFTLSHEKFHTLKIFPTWW